MKQWLLIAELQGDGVIALDFDTKSEADEQYRIFIADDMEAGPIARMKVGPNMNWVCPICDGGPGNYCNCSCPKS